MSPADDDDTSNTEEGTMDERVRQAIQARFAHLNPEKRLRLQVELLRFLSQSVIMSRDPMKPHEDGEKE